MITSTIYQDLNISEGASINEIKAAFRTLAKECHPDSAQNGQADVEKFIKAQSAYQKLMKKAVAHNQARRAARKPAAPTKGAEKPAAETREKPADNWRFIGRREVGLDVYFSLHILRPAAGGAKVTLPWAAREACPRCLGQGRTLGPISAESPVYRPHSCPKCGGTGTLSRPTKLEVNLTADKIGQSKIRLRKAGLYNAKAARRGDLILDVTWVDELPRHN